MRHRVRYATPLSVQLNQNDYYQGVARQEVESRLKAGNTDPAALELKYNERTGILSKTLIFLFMITLHSL